MDEVLKVDLGKNFSIKNLDINLNNNKKFVLDFSLIEQIYNVYKKNLDTNLTDDKTNSDKAT